MITKEQENELLLLAELLYKEVNALGTNKYPFMEFKEFILFWFNDEIDSTRIVKIKRKETYENIPV